MAAEAGSGHVGVEADQARTRVEDQMQQGDVAVAEDGFGVGFDRLDVDQVEVAEGCLASVVGDDRAYLGIAEEAVELGGDLRGGGGAPPMPAPYLEERGPAHPETHPLEHDDRLLDVGLVDVGERAGQGRDHDEVPGLQSAWTQRGKHSGILPARVTNRHTFPGPLAQPPRMV
ncbi:hypothetical protein FHR83_008684 [Actinoplanes campanulatus]|uniref:Uncharacterized protein n=1 Tax=Actinoplanes campanulatus TaxID=113559 RepID=A0A7W5ARL2_9ACTN|nr:hypothetical protein [Actinoplanes campanulatus]MBB3100957.1 hypothetical protein [Actinoplanes campanulatus]GGN48971.1 hypothetical protein GCM10010109_86500 [Actinoplanes campanulatus]GID41776.1 hypothetical protein Aca09nite_82820 [Actinoplanes campanulatus]